MVSYVCSPRLTGFEKFVQLMVIGNGLLARRFADYEASDNIIIFASGVSDSKLTIESEYQREVDLLEKTMQDHAGKLLVYFSTCSVLDMSLSNQPYIRHKFFVEKRIQQQQQRFLIFRISNLVGHGGNPKTIMNYLVNVVQRGIHFELWQHAYRNLLDVDDAYLLMDHFIRSGVTNHIINIANPLSYSSLSIVQSIEAFLGKKANYDLVDKGENFFIDTIAVEDIASKIGISFSGNYLQAILQKYYSAS
jgi:nucleoside-diphosphate-sugar epimerase